jgi:proline iminopeptidase
MKNKKSIVAICAAFLFLFSACTKNRLINEEANLVPKTVEQDASLPSIAVNNTVLHAEAFGPADSAMIIVLHGGPGSDYRSLLNCKEFSSQGYRVIFYDQRGSGLSKRHSKESYSLQVMYDDLSAVITHYRTSPSQKVFLLGHSWGAILAAAYINKNPTAINGVILAEPGGLVWQDIMDYLDRAKSVKITSELLNDILYPDQFITGKEDEHAILDYKYALLAIADGAKENPTGNEGKLPFWRYGYIVNKALSDIGDNEKPDFTTNLHQYNKKVLFAYSERNKAYGLQYAQKVSSAFPNVQLVKVNGAGHDLFSFPTGWSNFYPVALTYLNSLK